MPQRKMKKSKASNGTRQGVAKSRHPGQAVPARNWPKIGAVASGAVLVVALIAFLASGAASQLGGVPEGVEEVAVGPAAHVEGDIDYDGHPAGGEHSAVWLNCGAYSEPVPEENAVHSLEHGAV